MIFNANQSDYMTLTDRAGFVLIFHKQLATVFAETSGYKVPPGLRTNFALTMVI